MSANEINKVKDGEPMTDVWPVSGFKCGHLPGSEVVVLNLNYLTSAEQTPENAELGRFYGLSPTVALDLMKSIASGLYALKEFSDSKGDFH